VEDKSFKLEDKSFKLEDKSLKVEDKISIKLASRQQP
jgi:hypothetical protein